MLEKKPTSCVSDCEERDSYSGCDAESVARCAVGASLGPGATALSRRSQCAQDGREMLQAVAKVSAMS